MTRDDLFDVIGECRKRVALSAAFDLAGFHDDSDRVRDEVEAVLSPESPDGGKFKRLAIRGYTSGDEYIKNIMRGIGTGAAYGGTAAALGSAGIGAPVGAGIGAVVGGIGGAVSGPLQDVWFRNVNGRLSRAKALASDFSERANAIASSLKKEGNEQGAETILQASQILQQRVMEQYEGMKTQISQQMGITPDQDKRWYSSWLPKIERYYRMMRSDDRSGMRRTSAVPGENQAASTSGLGDFASGPGWVTDPMMVAPTASGMGAFGPQVSAANAAYKAAENVGKKAFDDAIKRGLSKTMANNIAKQAAKESMTAAGFPNLAPGLALTSFIPIAAGMLGGFAGGAAGGWMTGQIHGGGAQAQVRMRAEEMGQIIPEIEKQLGISLGDVSGMIYQAIGSGFGDQYAGEFGAGYGRQTGNRAVQQYFGDMSRQSI